MYSASLKETFNISFWLLIVPIVTRILIAKQAPSIVTLFISTMLAGIFALIFQPHLLQEISGLPIQDMQSQFKGLLMTFYGSIGTQAGNPDLNDLVSTRDCRNCQRKEPIPPIKKYAACLCYRVRHTIVGRHDPGYTGTNSRKFLNK